MTPLAIGVRLPGGCDNGPVADPSGNLGELQAEIMTVLWRLEAGTVEQVRRALPSRYRGAYTTVQTVLNRLTERGFLTRKREGQAFVYRPKITEAQYLSCTIQDTLASASPDARQAVLAQLVSGLAESERADLLRLAAEVDAARKSKRTR